MKKYLAMLTLMASLSATAATPTFAQVEASMSSKDYDTAKVLMEDILRKRPESVRAHSLNATLILASGGDKKAAESEINLVEKLKGEKEIIVIAHREPEKETSNFVRNGIISLCLIAAIIACFLGKEYANIRSRTKVKVKEFVDSSEKDPTNYSTTMTTHQM